MQTRYARADVLPGDGPSSSRRHTGVAASASSRSRRRQEPASDAVFCKDLVQLMPYLNSFALSLCKDIELAKDLAQETLCKAWKARMSFRAGTNLKAWLFAILRNQLYTHHRRAWRQAPYDEAAALNICGPEEPQGWAATASDAVRALHGLSREQREALVLVGLGGIPYAEAAVITGHPVGTLKSRVTRARKAASAALEGHVKFSAPRPPIAAAAFELIRELDDVMP